MTSLSVNLNKIALLRNSRGEGRPDIRRAGRVVLDAGAHGLTVHPRPDRRHIHPEDVHALGALCRERGVEFNVEGNPFTGQTADYPGFLALVEAVRPDQATLVPDASDQLTSDHGFRARDAERLAPVIAGLRAHGIRVSLFVDPGDTALAALAEAGADRVEIYTGPYARAFAAGEHAAALADCVATARAAERAGMEVNAGHDLDQGNLASLRRAIPDLREVSIGHALIDDALYAGLAVTTRAYLAQLA